MGEARRRIALAWSALRRGGPAAQPVPEQVTVPIADLLEAVRWALIGAGLYQGVGWLDQATSDELLCAHGAIGIAITTRRQEWEALEAGGWR